MWPGLIYTCLHKNMTGTDLYMFTHKSVPVIFETPCVTMCVEKLLLLYIQGELSWIYLENALILSPRELRKFWSTVTDLNYSKFQIISGYREDKVIICTTTKLETFPLLYHLCKSYLY
jgi:hypothetical protein